MSAQVTRDLLEMEKIRQDIETELARRHNWAEQERFWEREARMSRGRNYIAVAAVAASITAACIGIAARFL